MVCEPRDESVLVAQVVPLVLSLTWSPSEAIHNSLDVDPVHDKDWRTPEAISLKIGVLANVHDDPFHVAGYASTLPLTVSSHSATQLVAASTQLRPASVNDESIYGVPT